MTNERRARSTRRTRFADFPALVGAAAFMYMTVRNTGEATFVAASVMLMLGAPFQRIVEVIFGRYQAPQSPPHGEEDQ